MREGGAEEERERFGGSAIRGKEVVGGEGGRKKGFKRDGIRD